MVAIKSQSATSFLAKPDPGLRAILLFGTDPGLVSERAQKLAQTLATREQPEGEVVRLGEADLDGDAGRLSVELLTMPMFGGAKIVRTEQSRRITAAVLKPILEGPLLPGALIVEAGNLRPDDALRALFEKAANAAAIGCYADEGAALGQLIQEILGRAGLKIDPEARQELQARLGADRGLSRSEIEKLALFASGEGTVTVDHVEAIVGDASELTIDRILEAATAGDTLTALAEFDRAVTSGENPQTIVLAAQRQFHRLHRARAALDAGRSLDDVIRGMRPPLYFKARAAFEQQLRRWPLAQLGIAQSRIATAAKQARLAGPLESVVAERLMLDLARLARQSASTTSRN
ncbi:MAG: DNA polymerase III subunit delta [Hyphomicrobiaceae bacterium]